MRQPMEAKLALLVLMQELSLAMFPKYRQTRLAARRASKSSILLRVLLLLLLYMKFRVLKSIKPQRFCEGLKKIKKL